MAEIETPNEIANQLINLFELLQNQKKYFKNDKDFPDDKNGVYVFYDGETPLYVGRTMLKFKQRFTNHTNNSNDCPLAVQITRKKFGEFNTNKTRRFLMENEPSFRIEYEKAKEYVRNLKMQFITIECQTTQAMFEPFVAKILNTKFNIF